MAKDAERLGPARLRAKFIQVTRAGTLGGSAILDELSELAGACISGSPAEFATLAYVLHKMLAAVANDRAERAVSASEDQRFLAGAHQPLLEAVELLNSGTGADRAVALAARLIAIEEETTAPREAGP